MKRPPGTASTLLPSEASTVLTVVAGLIGGSGVLLLLALVVTLLSPLLGGPWVFSDWRSVLAVIFVGAFGSAYVLTGIWLRQGRRRGAYLAIGALSLDLLSVMFRTARPSLWDFLLPVAALVGVALAWPHLSEEGRDVEEPVRIAPRRR